MHLILTQGRIRRQLERAVEPSELVGGELFGENFFTFGILDFNAERPTGEIGGVGLIVARACDPEFESHRRARAIDRPVGDQVDLHLVISGIALSIGPDVREAEMGQPALGRGGGDHPLVVSAGVDQAGSGYL